MSVKFTEKYHNALVEILEDYEKRIKTLEKKCTELEKKLVLQQTIQQVSVFHEVCPAGGAHEYPSVWFGVTPPPCNKCYRTGPSLPTVTCLSDS